MPRYEVTLKLTLDAESQHDAAEMADEFCAAIEDGGDINGLADLLPPGDTSLRPATVSWPLEG